MLPDAAFIIVREDEVEIVDQKDIHLVIADICKKIMSAFGICGYEIKWNDE